MRLLPGLLTVLAGVFNLYWWVAHDTTINLVGGAFATIVGAFCLAIAVQS